MMRAWNTPLGVNPEMKVKRNDAITDDQWVYPECVLDFMILDLASEVHVVIPSQLYSARGELGFL